MAKWLSSFSDELADRWDEYVDCVKRLQVEAPFLRPLLAPYRNGIIIDAAMGLGCEAIYLSQHGFNVIGNEIDSRMRAKAEQIAQAYNVSLQTSAVDWRKFLINFKESSVDAVLLLGNSLCLLGNADDRKNVCEQIFKVLKPEGVFIVDQRNFDYMFANQDEILSGTFEYSSRVMYCQRGIVGKPTDIEATRVRISCFDKSNNKLLGFFDVYPFRGNELQQLIKSVGFGKIDTYFDFKGESPPRWDFATLVCHKRRA